MNDFNMILDLIGLGCGVYCMYTWLKLQIGGVLFKNSILVPKELDVSDCVDEAGYVQYMKPRLAVLAIVVMLGSVLMMLNDTVMPVIPYPWSLVPVVLMVAVLVWYAVCNSHANRDYFGL